MRYPASYFQAALLLVFLAASRGAAEDASARSERFNDLVESLNASSERRGRVVDAIYNELKGPDAREMRELLHGTLDRPNTFILQGVAEALAMGGDDDDVPAMETLLACSSNMEVKGLTARLLPAFCLTAERARFNYIRYAAGYDRSASPAVLATLRRPPLTRRGRLDPDLDRLRTRVTVALVGQFDPVHAAIGYVNDPRYQAMARATVSHYVGNALGNDPLRWEDIWTERVGRIPGQVPADLEEIRTSVLQTLADMGAEGLPEVIAGLDRLDASAGDVVSQALFDAVGTMCLTSFAEAAALNSTSFDPGDGEEGRKWRLRRFVSAENLALFAAARANLLLTAGTGADRFASATSCLAAALSYPPGFPDPDGRLAAARAGGMATLERLLMLPDLGWEKRAAVLAAFGGIGLDRGVSGIEGILSSPYVSADSPGGLRLAEAAVDALAGIAVGDREARDEARRLLLDLLADSREYPPARPGGLPIGVSHLALWRLQRLARSADIVLDPAFWRARLGW